MSGRVDMFVAAMIEGRAPSKYESMETKIDLGEAVKMAIRLDQLIAEHELREITPPAYLTPDQLAPSQKITPDK